MSEQKTIALFGATGMLALPVVKSFLNSGFKVKALVRDVAKAEKLYQHTIELHQGSLNSIIDIEKVIKGSDAVYCNLSINPESTPEDFQPEREGLDNLLSVAGIMKVSQFGYIASLVQRYEGMNDFHWWVFELKNQAIAKIKKSGIPYTIFYPSTFMENWSAGHYRNGDKLLLAGKSRFPMWYIAGEDYGKQVAEAFKNEECLNAEFDIQGPEAYTQSQAGAIFAKNNPKPLKIYRLPGFILSMMAPFNQRMNYGAKIVKALNNYPEKFDAETTWKILGKPRITLEEFAKLEK
jgi:uncharacterized protein YbjT (DUF2867 family)